MLDQPTWLFANGQAEFNRVEKIPILAGDVLTANEPLTVEVVWTALVSTEVTHCELCFLADYYSWHLSLRSKG